MGGESGAAKPEKPAPPGKEQRPGWGRGQPAVPSERRGARLLSGERVLYFCEAKNLEKN